MKPLTHWAIHHQLKIRIAGRDQDTIWGALASANGAAEPFRYAQNTLRLTIGEGDRQRILQLDAYGFDQEIEG